MFLVKMKQQKRTFTKKVLVSLHVTTDATKKIPYDPHSSENATGRAVGHVIYKYHVTTFACMLTIFLKGNG